MRVWQEGLERRRLGPALGGLFPFPDPGRADQQRRGRDRAVDHADGAVARPFGGEEADEHGGQRRAHQVRGHREAHPRGGEAGALVIIIGELGRQRVVGHVGERPQGIEEQERAGDPQEHPDRLQSARHEPQQRDADAQRDRAEDHVDAALAEALRSRPVGHPAEQRVVDRIPDLADEQGAAHQRGRQQRRVGVEDQQKELQRRVDQRVADVADAVEYLGAGGEFVPGGLGRHR